MLPNKVIYKGKEYETIGFIKLNNGSFLFLRNNEDVVGLDLSKINLKLDLKFEIKEATKVELVLIDYIVEAIKNDIRSGKYQNKEDLKKDIVDLNKYINTHKDLLNNMKQLDFKDELVNKTITNLLSYFDEVMSNAPLNLENITSFQVDGKSYIRYKDATGHVKIMDDNVDNRNFVEQFKAKQNESKYFKQEDGKESALNIAEDMNKYQKTSVELNDVDVIDNVSKEQELPNKAMQEYDQKDDKSIVGNTEAGIYYDENSNQLLTTTKKDGEVVISEVNEVTTEENSKTNEKEKQKIKIFTLNDNRKPNAAFVDTLLLSFIVGLVSGMYLVFLILIIMS